MFPYVVLIVLSAFAQTFHLGLASPVTPASNDHGLIQKPWSNDTSLSTTPHALVIPPDPSVYRFPGTDLYITFRDFGDPLNKRDALGVLAEACAHISILISRSHDPSGGLVHHNYEFKQGTVRLRTFTNPPVPVDYESLRKLLASTVDFALRSGGFRNWRMLLAVKLGERSFLKLASAMMTEEEE